MALELQFLLGRFNESPMQVCGLGYVGPHTRAQACVREAGLLGNGCPVAKFPSSQPTCLHSLTVPAFPLWASRGLLKDTGIQTQSLAPSPSLLRPTVCWELRLEEASVTSLLHQGHPGMVFEMASLPVSQVCLPLTEGIDFSSKAGASQSGPSLSQRWLLKALSSTFFVP